MLSKFINNPDRTIFSSCVYRRGAAHRATGKHREITESCVRYTFGRLFAGITRANNTVKY